MKHDQIAVQLITQIWKDKETNSFVAYVPQLDVSSCGETVEEARKNIRDAVEGFLESAQKQNTLQEILEEAGFSLEQESWKAPDILLSEKVQLAF